MLSQGPSWTLTDPTELGRGTIQGDIPLPILFLICMVPLTWLQSGGQGCKYTCLSNTSPEKHTSSNLAYGVNLAAMTTSIANLKVQAQKIQASASLSTDSRLQEVCHHWCVLWTSTQGWWQQGPVQIYDTSAEGQGFTGPDTQHSYPILPLSHRLLQIPGGKEHSNIWIGPSP